MITWKVIRKYLILDGNDHHHDHGWILKDIILIFITLYFFSNFLFIFHFLSLSLSLSYLTFFISWRLRNNLSLFRSMMMRMILIIFKMLMIIYFSFDRHLLWAILDIANFVFLYSFLSWKFYHDDDDGDGKK